MGVRGTDPSPGTIGFLASRTETEKWPAQVDLLYDSGPVDPTTRTVNVVLSMREVLLQPPPIHSYCWTMAAASSIGQRLSAKAVFPPRSRAGVRARRSRRRHSAGRRRSLPWHRSRPWAGCDADRP